MRADEPMCEPDASPALSTNDLGCEQHWRLQQTVNLPPFGAYGVRLPGNPPVSMRVPMAARRAGQPWQGMRPGAASQNAAGGSRIFAAGRLEVADALRARRKGR